MKAALGVVKNNIQLIHSQQLYRKFTVNINITKKYLTPRRVEQK